MGLAAGRKRFLCPACSKSARRFVSSLPRRFFAMDPAETIDPPVVPAPDARAFIRMNDVSRFYPMGQVHALRSVSLTIGRGGFTAIVGRSGSGKSTLLHLLASLDRPTYGEIVVGGQRLASMDRRTRARYRRERVGMIFQAFHLIPTMTALENVALPMMLAGMAPADRRARARACLDRVDMAHRDGHRPTELSGGEQQRVAIARALALHPPLLLADEPTGNLDAETAGQIIALLARIQREEQTTVLVVTHDRAGIAPVADRIVTLHDGRIVEG